MPQQLTALEISMRAGMALHWQVRERRLLLDCLRARHKGTDGHVLATSGYWNAAHRMIGWGYLSKVDPQPAVPGGTAGDNRHCGIAVVLTEANWRTLVATVNATAATPARLPPVQP